VRLGVYADLLFRREGATVSADRAFIRFVSALPPRVDELVLFGRLEPESGRYPYALPEEAVRFVPLPHYPSLRAPAAVAGALRDSVAVFRAELERLDAVWLFGPHPLALAFARAARRTGRPVVLGVRQDLPRYVAGRVDGGVRAWAVPAAWTLEGAFRLAARRLPAVVAGADLAGRYAGGAPVHEATFSLVEQDDVVAPETALARSWEDGLQVISVGRLDPEKNPLLLVAVLAALRARSPRWRLLVVGDGELGPALEGRAAEAGVADAVELAGYVPNGPALRTLYGASHAFLHVSRTEGLPQVLLEAQAAGLPVVATDVGGVSPALGEGASGLLVPPGDAEAAAAALARLADDEALRRKLVLAGLANASARTLEAELDRLAAFLRAATV
jgi:glycosyltransferase involved in cell wall biosynthesis